MYAWADVNLIARYRIIIVSVKTLIKRTIAPVMKAGRLTGTILGLEIFFQIPHEDKSGTSREAV